MAKRAREKARLQRQEAKRLRRETLTAGTESLDGATESRLMEQFRLLSEQYASGKVSESTYDQERRRIFVELGIERDEGR